MHIVWKALFWSSAVMQRPCVAFPMLHEHPSGQKYHAFCCKPLIALTVWGAISDSVGILGETIANPLLYPSVTWWYSCFMSGPQAVLPGMIWSPRLKKLIILVKDSVCPGSLPWQDRNYYLVSASQQKNFPSLFPLHYSGRSNPDCIK